MASAELLKDLGERLRRGVYEPAPSCKLFLPKPSGVLRPSNENAQTERAVARTVRRINHGSRTSAVDSETTRQTWAIVISPKTAATHIQRILSKLGVRSRAQAVALVLREERDVNGHAAEGLLGLSA